MDRKQREKRSWETVKLGDLLAHGNGIAKEMGTQETMKAGEKVSDIWRTLTVRVGRPRVWFRIM